MLPEVITCLGYRSAQVRGPCASRLNKAAPFGLSLLRRGVGRLKERLELKNFKLTSFHLQVALNLHQLLLLPLDLLLTVQFLLFQLVLEQFNLLQLSVKLEL